MDSIAPTAPARTTPALAKSQADTTCPTWCLRHDAGAEDLCLGPALELDFGPARADFVNKARILSYNEPGGIVTLSLIITGGSNGFSSADLTPVQARQIAAALIQAADAVAVTAAPQAPHLTLVSGGAR